MFAKNTSVKNSSAKQTGWVREDDKPLFLEFTNSIDDHHYNFIISQL